MGLSRRGSYKTPLLAALNYVLLFGYATFLFFAFQADRHNVIYWAVCTVLGSVCVGVGLIGLTGIVFSYDPAIRGTFTLLILEHIIGFIMGALLLIECFVQERHGKRARHGAKMAAFFRNINEHLAVAVGASLVVAALIGCATVSSVAECQTAMEVETLLNDHREREGLLGGKGKDLSSAERSSVGGGSSRGAHIPPFATFGGAVSPTVEAEPDDDHLSAVEASAGLKAVVVADREQVAVDIQSAATEAAGGSPSREQLVKDVEEGMV